MAILMSQWNGNVTFLVRCKSKQLRLELLVGNSCQSGPVMCMRSQNGPLTL